jgi:hypothetical protein
VDCFGLSLGYERIDRIVRLGIMCLVAAAGVGNQGRPYIISQQTTAPRRNSFSVFIHRRS